MKWFWNDGEVGEAAGEVDGEDSVGRLENSTMARGIKPSVMYYVDDDKQMDSQSMSTERTLAPSFANNAASGLPTTSDLDTVSPSIQSTPF